MSKIYNRIQNGIEFNWKEAVRITELQILIVGTFLIIKFFEMQPVPHVLSSF